MPNRNPNKPHRFIEANQRKTLKAIERYQGTVALLKTWETQSDEVQSQNHDYIIELRAKVRTCRNYLLHRADAASDI